MASEIAKSVISRQPQTINSLQYNQFRFVLHRTPKIIYFCQEVKFPGLSMNTIDQPNPLGTPIKRTPNKIAYDNLELSFLVAEDFNNWLEIYNWMHRIVPIKNFDNQYKEKSNNIIPDSTQMRFQDASLVLMNSVSKGFKEVMFTNCFPISLGGIDFSSTVTDSKPVVSTVQFAFSGYTINNV